jgi:L-fuconolactonase
VRYRPLGRTGLEVSPLGFGAAPLGAVYGTFAEQDGITDQPRVLDSHVHFWDPARLSYPWLAGTALKHAFTPADVVRAQPTGTEVIFVEAGRLPGQASDEIEWIRSEARSHHWIRGVVAHAPIEDGQRVETLIERYAADPFVVGVRRNLQDEPVGFTTGAEFRTGLRLLGDAGLPFDACVSAHQLDELDELAAAAPQTTIVLDHLGKPSPGEGDREAWRDAIRRLALRPNVVCKLSGLATEALPGTSAPQLLRCLREALDAFGPDRCLFGSDWPVMTLATEYGPWLDLVRTALTGQPPQAADAVLYANAAHVYRLEPDPSRRDFV